MPNKQCTQKGQQAEDTSLQLPEYLEQEKLLRNIC